jgi:hypothetical protein
MEKKRNMKEVTRTRLELVIAKAKLVLSDKNPWHEDALQALREISSEAERAYREVADDHSWALSDR